MTRQQLDNPDKYTIAWIAPLFFECAAAIAMLDERHEEPCGFIQHAADLNSYNWGRMGKHNVVIASLPAGSKGTTPAATTASSLLASLPQIKISLLVGIGGGIARPDKGCSGDIRLGDVVVSNPEDKCGGVIQYDLGKARTDQRWERTGVLGAPPLILTHAVANLRANYLLGDSRLSEFLGSMVIKVPKGRISPFAHPGSQNDRLFKSSYDHVGDPACCKDCDTTQTIQRVERQTDDPEVHYGIIASGNTLFKDAFTRDRIVEDLEGDCICFEMEAAGLMNHFPCLVIRGISDYADSHKNDQWQMYASATAAAFAKDLLAYVPAKALQATQRALDVLSSNVKEIHKVTSATQSMITDLQSDKYHKDIAKWLSPPDPSFNLNEALKKRYVGTGDWLLQSKLFEDWEIGTHSCLWLYGIPGCGKTLLSARVIEHLREQQCDSARVILDFFFDFADASKQTPDSLLRSLVMQSYWQSKASRHELDSLFHSFDRGRRQPTFKALLDVLMKMMAYMTDIHIVIDALDECKQRPELFPLIQDLFCSGHTGLHVFLTSRREVDIEAGLRLWIGQDHILSIEESSIDHDIRAYIHDRLHCDTGFSRWRSTPAVLVKIENELMKKAKGMFRWVACQIDSLREDFTIRMLETSLQSLPGTLEETYTRILHNITPKNRDYATRILQFLTYSKRPLKILEAIEIIAVDPSLQTPFNPDERMPDPRDIVSMCSSLVCLVEKKSDKYPEAPAELQLAHFSVQQFLQGMSLIDGTPRVTTILEGRLNERHARADITKVCLAYLSHLNDRTDLDELKQDFPFSMYAAQYWTDHAQIGETDDETLAMIVNVFLQKIKGYKVWHRLFDLDAQTVYRMKKTTSPVYYAVLAGLKSSLQRLLENGLGASVQGGHHGNALQAASYRGDKDAVQLLLASDANVNAPGGPDGRALQAASLNGHTDIVRLLIANGASVNTQNNYASKPRNALQAASSRGHADTVRLLLENGADVNKTDDFEGTALSVASLRGHREVVHVLVDHGASVDIQGLFFKHSALHNAARSGHMEILQLLLDTGADVNLQDAYDGTVLRVAASSGKLGAVRLLVDKGADVNVPNEEHGSALYAASSSQEPCVDIVRLLLERGADLNLRGGYHGAALCAASSQGHQEIVQLLLESGADINIPSSDLTTALESAAFGGHTEVALQLLEPGTISYGSAIQKASSIGRTDIVQLLLDNGADINACDDYFGTALQAASAWYLGYQTVQLLLERGADLTLTGGPNGNALRAAALNGYKDIVQLLLEKGADVNAQSDHGNAIQAALSQGHGEIVQILLENGANALDQGEDFQRFLLDASARGFVDIVRLLISNGADVNAYSEIEGNALLAASSRGHREVVVLLLRHGADVNAEGGRHGNAFRAALCGGHTEILQILLDAGMELNAQVGNYPNALIESSLGGHKNIVQLLVDTGFDMAIQHSRHGDALQAASSHGHFEIAQLLLARGASVHAQGGNYGNALQASACHGHTDIVKLLLANGAAVDMQGGYYGTALTAASMEGHVEVIHVLLANGADVNANTGLHGSALQIAFSQNHQEIVQVLLKHGAQTNTTSEGYNDALQAATAKGFHTAVQFLLDSGVEIDAKGDEHGNALQIASYRGYKDIAQLLLQKGANVNANSGTYGSALQAAAYEGFADIVRLLLAKGADVNAQCGEYGNSLQAASFKGHQDIVQLLIDQGADVCLEGPPGCRYTSALAAALSGLDLKNQLLKLHSPDSVRAQCDSLGFSPSAASHQSHTGVVQLLLEKGAEKNMKGGFQKGILQAAARGGHMELVQLLLEKGVHIDAQDCEYIAAIESASSHGHMKILQLLLANDTGIKEWDFGNALVAATSGGYLEIIQLFSEKGTDVNSKGGFYGSALQAASYRGDMETVQLLLQNGANVNMPGGNFGSALNAALSEGRHDISRLLLEIGADIDIQDGDAGNALLAASGSSSGNTEIVNSLLRKGANVNTKGGCFGNALQAASGPYGGGKEIVELLLQKGADVNAQGGYYGNALQAASAARNGTEVVQLLLSRGADINAQGGYYGNALQAASANFEDNALQADFAQFEDEAASGPYGDGKEIVELLLQKGADVNAQGGYHGSALQAASAQHSSTEVVQLLLSRGADVNAQGGHHGNALQAALRDEWHNLTYSRGSKEIALLLLENGAKMPDKQCQQASG